MKKLNVGKWMRRNLHIIIDGFILMPVDTYMASPCFTFCQAVCNGSHINSIKMAFLFRLILRTREACLCDKKTGSFFDKFLVMLRTARPGGYLERLWDPPTVTRATCG